MKRAVVMVHELTDAKKERLCCRQDIISQEAVTMTKMQSDGPSSGSHIEEIYIKSEVPDAELEAVAVKDEPMAWYQEPQASSSSGSHAVTFKGEVDNDCTEARSGRAEAEDELREGSSGACNTSAVHEGPAGASQGSAASPPSAVSRSGSGVEAAPPDALTSPPLRCAHCDLSTGRRDLMELHLRVSHELGCYYECGLCDYSTMYMSTLKRHLVEQHDHENLCEGQCGRYEFPGVKIMEEQRHERHVQEELKCECCGSILVIASSSETPKKRALDNSGMYKCEVCKYTLGNEANFKERLSGNRKIRLQTIEHGLDKFNERKLKDHLSARKNEQEVSKRGKGWMFKCELCDYSAAQKRTVQRHRASKHGKGQPFNCELCEYFSVRKDMVKLHLASKHGKGQLFKCELCDYSTAENNKVKLHLASKHGKGQLFKCDLCDYSSALKNRINEHVASKHGKGHLFKCEFCDYSSAQKSRVKLHLASKHGKGQLFKCELCDYSSAHKTNVKRHQAIKHGGQ